MNAQNELTLDYRSIDELIPYVNNSRTHSDEQVAQIAASIKEFGFLQPVVIDADNGIITGHGRIMALKKLGMDKVPTIQAGHLTDAQRRAYVIADNKLNDNSGWDNDLLSVELGALKDSNFDIGLLGFEAKELANISESLFGEAGGEGGENPYTAKIKTPVYEPSDKTPEFREMFDDEKVLELIDQINESSLDNETKKFLRMAAYRHTVFDYEKIADFYSNADRETQELMEQSALVIVDADRAIEYGFVKLSDELKRLLSDEREK